MHVFFHLAGQAWQHVAAFLASSIPAAVRLRFAGRMLHRWASICGFSILGATATFAAKPVITSATSAGASLGGAFSYQIVALNDPLGFTATGLPAGLSLDAVTGLISGAPEEAGNFAIVLGAVNASGTGTARLRLAVLPPLPLITSPLVAEGQVGSAFNYLATASNGPASLVVTGLPPGLKAGTSNGKISGKPTDAGKFDVGLAATNAGGTTTATLSVAILPATPVITSAKNAHGKMGELFVYQVTATGDPTDFNATGLPPGLDFDSAAGGIAGVPAVAGTFSIALAAMNAGGTGTMILKLTIKLPKPAITSATVADGQTGIPFIYQVIASNSPTNYTATGLPAGLSLDTDTGLISGVPSVSGSFKVRLAATNATGTGRAAVMVTIGSNQSPIISLNSTDLLFSAAAPVSLSFAATSVSNNIASVEIYRDGILVMTLTPPASGLTWTFTEPAALPPGTYSYFARAYDVTGAHADSSIAVVSVQPVLPYMADFESAEDYGLGPLSGRLGWNADPDAATVSNLDFAHGTQSVQLSPHDPPAVLGQTFAEGSGQSIEFFDFYARPVVGALPGTTGTFTVEQSEFAFQLTGSEGALQVLSGDANGGGTWLPTSFAIPVDANHLAQDWVRLTARLDFARQLWDLYANSRMVAADVPFAGASRYLSTFQLQGGVTSALGLDDIYAGPANPLFADVNNDGIDDDWESSHGLSLATNNRAVSPAGNGVTVLQAYLTGVDPNDYYNGTAPVITWLNEGIPDAQGQVAARVTTADGTVLVNAPISLSLSSGTGLSTVSGGPFISQITVRTDASGIAKVYVNFGSTGSAILSASPQGGISVNPVSVAVSSPRPISPYIFIDLGANTEPIGIATDGTITLRSGYYTDPAYFWGGKIPQGGILARWRNGIITNLQPSSSTYDYPIVAVDPTEADNMVSLSSDGWILSNAWDSGGDEFNQFQENFAVCWPNTTDDAPLAIKGPVGTTTNDDDHRRHYTSSLILPLALDDANEILAFDYNNTSPWLYTDAINRAPYFSSGQLGGIVNINVIDFNFHHQTIGNYYDPATGAFTFAGAITGVKWPRQESASNSGPTNYTPLAINNAGQILGQVNPYDLSNSGNGKHYNADVYGAPVLQFSPGNSVWSPFVLTGSTRQYLQGVQDQAMVRITGFDDAGNVYGSINPHFPAYRGDNFDPGQNVIWVAHPADWGLAAETAPYTPVSWITPVLPADYTSLYGVRPGSTRVELGLATKIDSNGEISTHGFALVPAGLAVDANRDGQIKFASEDNSDATSAAAPFRFWINDGIDGPSTDSGESSVEDDLDPSTGLPNCQQGKVTCARDLENFGRLWMSIGGLSQAISSGLITVGLEWQSNTGDAQNGWEPDDGAPAINIYAAVPAHGEPVSDGGSDYLTDPETASDQVDSPSAITLGTVAKDQPLYLSPAFFADLSSSHPRNYFLFEGVGRGKGRLVLTLNTGTPGNHVKFGEGGATYMDLRNIKELYERWTVGDGPSLSSISVGGGGSPAASAFISDRRLPAGVHGLVYGPGGAGLSIPDDSNGSKYILFVHGWNLPPWEKDAFAETALKRLYWQGYKGRFGTFQWPTTYTNSGSDYFDNAAQIPAYDDGEFSAWQSAAPLAQLLRALHGGYGDNVYLLAHSMGNVVAGEALRIAGQSSAGRLINTYVATQAAVPAHCYDPTLAGSDLLDFSSINLGGVMINGSYGPDTPDIHSNWLAASGAAVQARANFYNVNDFALRHWWADQVLKPDLRDQVYYYASSNLATAQNLFKKSTYPDPVAAELIITSHTGIIPTQLNLGSSGNVQDRYEIMAYDAEPRSKALGAVADISSTGFGSSQDLQEMWLEDAFAPDNQPQNQYAEHPWHSAQFRFTNADQKTYWNILMKQFGLPTNQ